MTENDILRVLNSLKQEKEQVRAQLEHLDSVVAWYETKLLRNGQSTTGIANNIATPIFSEVSNPISQITPASPLQTSKKYSDFPENESIEAQITYLLEKVGRVIRFPDLEKEYTEASGTEKNIKNHCRSMRGNGRLVAAKFNNAWTLLFYGLPEWIEVDDNGKKTFKEEFRPSKSDLSTGYNTINFDF